MKILLVIASFALLTTACAAPFKSNSSNFSTSSGSSSPCGPEVEINANRKF